MLLSYQLCMSWPSSHTDAAVEMVLTSGCQLSRYCKAIERRVALAHTDGIYLCACLGEQHSEWHTVAQ